MFNFIIFYIMKLLKLTRKNVINQIQSDYDWAMLFNRNEHVPYHAEKALYYAHVLDGYIIKRAWSRVDYKRVLICCNLIMMHYHLFMDGYKPAYKFWDLFDHNYDAFELPPMSYAYNF